MMKFGGAGNDRRDWRGMRCAPGVPKMPCIGHSNITIFSFIKMFPPTGTFDFYSWLVGQEIKDYSFHVTGGEVSPEQWRGLGQDTQGDRSGWEMEPGPVLTALLLIASDA